ncbi:hypothetical protein EG348_14755 [Chryseobacterium sp. G0201]|nr:hypothetical protein EG348_14755 [Chryseobacterium sp. G0201]
MERTSDRLILPLSNFLLQEKALKTHTTLARIEAASFWVAAGAKPRTSHKRYSGKPDQAPEKF